MEAIKNGRGTGRDQAIAEAFRPNKYLLNQLWI